MPQKVPISTRIDPSASWVVFVSGGGNARVVAPEGGVDAMFRVFRVISAVDFVEPVES